LTNAFSGNTFVRHSLLQKFTKNLLSMKKKINSVVRHVVMASLLIVSGNVLGQSCSNPPNCIQNGSLTPVSATSGDMNSTSARNINDWFVSHGSPSIFPGRTGASGDQSVWMWSNFDGPAVGEGIFTCYNFVQGETYKICLWVKNTNASTVNGNLVIRAGNNLSPATTISQMPPFTTIPPVAGTDVIHDQNTFQTSWTLLPISNYQPSQNFNQLWIYPRKTGGNNQQYEIQVDDIVITKLISQNEISISASPSSINWCQSSLLSLNGVPAGATVNWSPATGLSSTTGTSVTASPCVTTTYTATVTLPGNSGCAACTTYTRTYTQQLVVSPPRAIISGNTNIICGDNLSLSGSLPAGCPIGSYTWTGPNGFSASGASFTINQPGASAAGIYTLTVTTSCGSFTQTVAVTYDCPCILNPTISTRGCNPVTFAVTNASLTNIVGWFWEFGDGNTSNLANPTHLYAQNGSYVVCVSVIGKSPRGEMCCTQICDTIQACGCSGAAPSFTWQQGRVGSATFTNTSLANANVCGWIWDFGDGNTSTANNPTHNYTLPGTYTVCLTALTCYPNPSTDQTDTCKSRVCQTVVITTDGSWRMADPGSGNTSDDNLNLDVKLFPNPASTELFVVLPEGISAQVRLLSADGKALLLLQNNGSNTYTANLKDIAPGMYLIEVVSNGKTTKRMPFVKE
jgi:PKD repeat protein